MSSPDADAEFAKYAKIIGGSFRSKMNLVQKTTMYGLWCVATRGKCTLPRPSRTKLIEYGKWSAWKKFENLSQAEAKAQFVERAKQIVAAKSKL